MRTTIARAVAASTALVLALSLSIAAATGASAEETSDTGRIVGTVQVPAGASASVQVEVLNEENRQVAVALADEDGFEVWLAPGRYWLRGLGDYRSTISTWWPGVTEQMFAGRIDVRAGETSRADLDQVAASSISGTISTALPQRATLDVVLESCRRGWIEHRVSVPASATGSDYTISALEPGAYRVSAAPRPHYEDGGTDELQQRWWHDSPSSDGAELVPTTPGRTAANIDIALPWRATKGTVGGYINTRDGSVHGTVIAYDLAGNVVDSTQTNGLKMWQMTLPAGQYKFEALTGSRRTWHDRADSFATATVETVEVGKHTYVYIFFEAVVGFPSGTAAARSAATSTDGHFADVGRDNPFFTEIEWMATSGMSTGSANPNGGLPLYKPLDNVSRQAYAAFLYRYSGLDFLPPSFPTFADVQPDNPFYTAIEWMAANGYTTGTAQECGAPLFNPTAPVSRRAAAAFFARYDDADLTPPTQQRFADVPVDAPFAAAIDWMAREGITTGSVNPAGGLPLYLPTDPVSRQAVAAFFSRYDAGPGAS